jgi:hypothetical protein
VTDGYGVDFGFSWGILTFENEIAKVARFEGIPRRTYMGKHGSFLFRCKDIPVKSPTTKPNPIHPYMSLFEWNIGAFSVTQPQDVM